jgi:hypothetical protein
MPVIRLIAVVFPAPLGPIIEKIKPVSTLRDRRLMACNPPKFFEAFVTSRMYFELLTVNDALFSSDYL